MTSDHYSRSEDCTGARQPVGYLLMRVHDIPERIRDAMWWKPTCLRPGEPYSEFRKRADAIREARASV